MVMEERMVFALETNCPAPGCPPAPRIERERS
jgi:hypothetical protein